MFGFGQYCSHFQNAKCAEFLANFFKQIVKKMDQKLILGGNFISKISEDFYALLL